MGVMSNRPPQILVHAFDLETGNVILQTGPNEFTEPLPVRMLDVLGKPTTDPQRCVMIEFEWQGWQFDHPIMNNLKSGETIQ